MTRLDGRSFDALRPVSMDVNVQRNPEGSLIYRCGGTSVLIAASISARVPEWMRETGRGWVTAEYEMHPRANPDRKRRDRQKGRIDGRSSEIQRLIARSLRSAVDLERLGERMITIDCDVIQADGGTRTASITGAYVALADAIQHMLDKKIINVNPIARQIASVSVGIYNGMPVLDLDYPEDSTAETDMNVIMDINGNFIEVQGTAEGAPFSPDEMSAMIALAQKGIGELIEHQSDALGG